MTFEGLSAGIGAAVEQHQTSSGSAGTHKKPSGKAEVGTAQKRFRARQKEKLSSLQHEVEEKTQEFSALARENEELRQRTSILEKVVSCRDEQLGMVKAFEERCSTTPEYSRSCFGSSSIHEGDPAVVAAQHELYRGMKKEQLIPQYKAFLAEVSSHLLHCQHPCCDADSPIVQKVTACVERMGAMLKHIVLLNTPLMRQLLSLNLETMQPAAAADSHWDDVITSLQLSAEQRADIMAVLELYRGLNAKVYEERKLIMAALGSGPGTLDLSAPSLLDRSGLAAEMELTERLSANLDKEHSARTLLCCFFFGKVLAPPQFAKVAVYSYPHFPDSLAVATAVARQSERLDGPTGRPSHSGSGTGSGSLGYRRVF
ncbi:hypothetical protein HYH03_015977 [Edaphochlamys debaryana]|uniref:BZIP domain-containing protein n=1 Tax=Edaphochlamys debaryana TaxID=47281 RepID=A0A835XM48_9CHLO|nr:hypothetical protein HYH03_015977 [Edaphochlamys debaryana]|eukprot:KAG2485303.1 hypothetical protein HYH03_015977 [Edaphochlamys debaryana]